jgi:non-heme chloroperoxidase
LLLHGYSDSWRSFLPLMDALPERFRVVALSMRGHGDSAKPPNGYDISTLADDVVAALDALGIGSTVVLGHSMGSLVAQRIAIEYPERVLRLVLIGAFSTIKGNAAVEAFWRDEVALIRDPVDPAFASAFQQSSVAVPLSDGFLESVVAESLKVPARVWQQMLRALLVDDHSDRLRGIAVPALIIWGDQDAFTGRSEQHLLLDQIPDARLSIYPGIGHAPHWEDTRRASVDIAAFVGAEDALAA